MPRRYRRERAVPRSEVVDGNLHAEPFQLVQPPRGGARVVEVDVQRRDLAKGAHGAEQHLLGSVHRKRTVRQPRQPVVQRLVGETRLRRHEVPLSEELANGHERGHEHGGDQDRLVGQPPVPEVCDAQHPEAEQYCRVRDPARPCLVLCRRLFHRIGSGLGGAGERERRHREHPHRVDRVSAVIGVVEIQVAEQHVGHNPQQQTRDHEPERHRARFRAPAQQHRAETDEEDDVSDRVCNRDGGAEDIRAGLGDRGTEHHVDDHRGSADRHNREVEAQAHRLAEAAPARRDPQQRPQHERVERQVEDVRGRRERVAADGVVHRPGDVADQVGAERDREESPGGQQPGYARTAPRREPRGEQGGEVDRPGEHGDKGRLLECLIAPETGDFDRARLVLYCSGQLYLEAIAWADAVPESLFAEARAAA
jgi:hypothetical protein